MHVRAYETQKDTNQDDQRALVEFYHNILTHTIAWCGLSVYLDVRLFGLFKWILSNRAAKLDQLNQKTNIFRQNIKPFNKYLLYKS